MYTAAIRYVTLHFRDQCGTTFVLQINVYKSFNEHCWKEYKTITHRSMGRVIKKITKLNYEKSKLNIIERFISSFNRTIVCILRLKTAEIQRIYSYSMT